MTNVQAAFDYIKSTTISSFSPVRQVSPGAVVVNIRTGAVAVCCMIELGKLWGLFDIETGHIVGHRFDNGKDGRSGLPIDGFVKNYNDYVVFFNGQISNETAGCKPLKKNISK